MLAGYFLEGTSTMGTSTRAWEGVEGAGTPAGIPKIIGTCLKNSLPLDTADSGGQNLSDQLVRPSGGRWWGVKG